MEVVKRVCWGNWTEKVAPGVIWFSSRACFTTVQRDLCDENNPPAEHDERWPPWPARGAGGHMEGPVLQARRVTEITLTLSILNPELHLIEWEKNLEEYIFIMIVRKFRHEGVNYYWS